MRDFRDAKAMAHALRDALKARSVETTHGESLELIAKAFGYEDWNILSAKIAAARSGAPDAAAPAPTGTNGQAPRDPLRCTFCTKSQHDVRVLVAGPASTYICDECVELCDDVIGDADDRAVSTLLQSDEESGNRAYPDALAHLRGLPVEEVTSYVARGRRSAERHRLTLHCIARCLALDDGEQPADGDILASPRFASLRAKPRDELVTLRQRTERALRRHEEALRIAVMVRDERRQ